jgi:hypothetical protein
MLSKLAVKGRILRALDLRLEANSPGGGASPATIRRPD